MKLIATLKKPYTNNQRCDFIVEQNHKLGYEIRETADELQAWGLDEEEQTEQTKQSVRSIRNEMLTSTDVYMIDDYPVTNRQQVIDYRRYLRDYTKNDGWWNEKPLDFDSWKEGTL